MEKGTSDIGEVAAKRACTQNAERNFVEYVIRTVLLKETLPRNVRLLV